MNFSSAQPTNGLVIAVRFVLPGKSKSATVADTFFAHVGF
jgi:hypothetical protein